MRTLLALSLAACLPDLGPRSAEAHARSCGACHAVQAEAFASSRHAEADASPLFQALRAAAPVPTACDTCHAPETGWSCLTCHAAAGNQRTADGLLLHDPSGPVRGPTGREDRAPHASAEDPFLVDSALCGTCHQLEGDGAFHETPYSHWAGSAAAARGDRCQDCHMSPAPGEPVARLHGPVADGAWQAPLADHGFVGLQRDPVTLLRAGLDILPTADGVRLVNRTGHALPDGAAFTRELWLEGRDAVGAWTGDVVPLHPELLDPQGRPTTDPFAATVVARGLAPDEVRDVPFGAPEVCLRYRPVARSLSSRVGLPDERAATITCVAR